MSTDQNLDRNKALYQHYIQQVFNQGQLDLLDNLLAPSYVYHEAPPGTLPGAAGIKQVVSMFRAAFPDLEITIDDQIAEDDKVCSRATTRGTHQGEIFGIPATGRVVTMTGLTVVRIVEGQIAESWVKNDLRSLMNQLGARSAPE
jgi:steroid delta-isomerase-like uncharacterized protein